MSYLLFKVSLSKIKVRHEIVLHFLHSSAHRRLGLVSVLWAGTCSAHVFASAGETH